ncbi:hypothetical protein CLOM_g2425 [Closterium sp. NIES-68]|nr:hypothetical protein CLOM_g2425 [Closterium sp. NIES-68]
MAHFAACKTTIPHKHCAATRHPLGSHQQSRPMVHVQLLEKNMGAVRHTSASVHGISPAIGVHQSDDGAADSHGVHRPGPMGRRPSLDRVCIQQRPIGHDYLVPVLPSLRDGSDNPSIAPDRKSGTKVN